MVCSLCTEMRLAVTETEGEGVTLDAKLGMSRPMLNLLFIVKLGARRAAIFLNRT